MKALIKSLLSIVILSAVSVHASAKVADCEITTDFEINYQGKCLFDPVLGNGSFLVSGKTFVKQTGLTLISVDISSPGKAYVRQIYDGHVSRWGNAYRSNQDRACWVSTSKDAYENFKICVR